MTAYLIFTRVKTLDQAEMDIYTETAQAALPGSELSPLVLYGEQDVLEGPSHEGMVIIAFPTAAKARAWYDSPSYREAREHRKLGADFNVTLVEGLPEDQIAFVRAASGNTG